MTIFGVLLCHSEFNHHHHHHNAHSQLHKQISDEQQQRRRRPSTRRFPMYLYFCVFSSCFPFVFVVSKNSDLHRTNERRYNNNTFIQTYKRLHVYNLFSLSLLSFLSRTFICSQNAPCACRCCWLCIMYTYHTLCTIQTLSHTRTTQQHQRNSRVTVCGIHI